jgi:hypothetical protein
MHARRARVQHRSKLATVQMPPTALVGVVVHAQFAAALGACKSNARRMRKVNIDAHLMHVHLHTFHCPRCRHTQQLPVEILAVHRVTSTRSLRDSVSTTHGKV